jgi:catechol 2,3-dioxygenase-like lactoylglutathione lyase family enzyme
MIYELNHVGEIIRNLDQSVAFYTELLDAKVVREAYIPSSDTKCVYVQIAGGMIEFLCRGDQSDPNLSYGFNHVAYMTDNIEGEYQRLAAAGAEFSVKPKIAGSGYGQVAFLADPNGVRSELIERPETFRQPLSAGGRIRSFDHISLVGDDLTGAEAFYTGQMGFQVLKRQYIAARELTMLYLMMGTDTIELLHRPTSQPGADRIGHIALRVDSVDAMYEFLISKGVQFEPGSPKAAGTGIGRVAVFRDPDGARIELVDRRDLREIH